MNIKRKNEIERMKIMYNDLYRNNIANKTTSKIAWAAADEIEKENVILRKKLKMDFGV